MKISDIQIDSRALCLKQGWTNTTAEQRFIRLMGEVGELADELIKRPDIRDDDSDRAVAYELYDIVWNVCDLANKLDIELEPYFEEKRQFNSDRHW